MDNSVQVYNLKEVKMVVLHNWRSMFVDTDTGRIGRHVILRFVDEDGETHEYRLNGCNVNWLRDALKKGKKLAKMADEIIAE